MPVQFKGASEYNTHFKWTESFRSKGFEPTEIQAAEPAGQASVLASVSVEPPLQHKKRLDGPPTSLSTNYFNVPSNDTEFALLGQQEKFASNVRYQPKPSYSGTKIYKNKENFDDAPPPSKQLKMQKRIKPLFKEKHPPVSRSPPRQASNTSTLQSPPPAPRSPRAKPDIKEALKDKDLKDVLGNPAPKETKVSLPQEAPSSHLEGRGNNMNEFVQTNMKKGVSLSGPEAPAEYALKYKAGVAPPRPVKKFSEYQRQFQWRDGMKASPLLAAEEVVYKSNAELGPYKTDSMPKLSEYQLQFKGSQLSDFAADVNLNVNNNRSTDNEQKIQEKKKTAMKRSKSAGAVLHREANEVEEVPADASSEDLLRTKLKKSHGKIKRLGSEYRANFKAPLKYSYTEGAWKGAAPPQMMPQASSGEETNANNNNSNNNNNNNSEEVPLSNWFAEVLELRRRANEYRKRAQGTHFSREHLVQLMAKQNQCWDLHSEGSSTVQALNLETPAMGIRGKEKVNVQAVSGPMEYPLVDAMSHEATEGDSPQMSDVEESKKVGGKEKVARKKGRSKGGRKSRKMAWLEEQKTNVADQRRQLEEIQHREETKDDDESEVGECPKGRLPTPVLQGEASSRRHHLDLTTPSVGGAILTCPPSKKSMLICTSRSGDSYVTVSDDMPVKTQPKKYNLDHLLTVPAGGKPSLDTHHLRDDTAESDRPLVAQYFESPPMPGSEEDKENKGQNKKKSKGNRPSNLSTVKEGYGKTYQPKHFLSLADIKASNSEKKDDDVMSVSMMSVASSSSLASEVLERAKKRQEFWTKKNS